MEQVNTSKKNNKLFWLTVIPNGIFALYEIALMVIFLNIDFDDNVVFDDSILKIFGIITFCFVVLNTVIGVINFIKAMKKYSFLRTMSKVFNITCFVLAILAFFDGVLLTILCLSVSSPAKILAAALALGLVVASIAILSMTIVDKLKK